MCVRRLAASHKPNSSPGLRLKMGPFSPPHHQTDADYTQGAHHRAPGTQTNYREEYLYSKILVSKGLQELVESYAINRS